MTTHSNKKRGIRLMDIPHMPAEQAITLLMQKAFWVREAMAKHCYRQISQQR